MVASSAASPALYGSDKIISSGGANYILWEKREALLSEGVGYGVVIGFGVAFSILTVIMHAVHMKFTKSDHTTDHFFTAGRNVGTGLTAAVIVSQWTWAATLLQSSSVGYKYGVSGPFWYASGATIQILLFAIIAVYMKRNVPKARTFLEIVKARFGPNIHIVFLCFALLTNLIVTAMLILGGAAVVEDLTGVGKELAAFLIPIGVIAYTMSGGLLATFVASYIHTGIIMSMLLIFIYTVYTGDLIGGPDGMFDKLALTQDINIIDAAAYARDGTIDIVYNKQELLADNVGNSYLTMSSLGGLIFGIINIVGNFGTVFVDQSYWQSAVAAKPSSSVPGFLIGGLVWFSIPFCLATTFGLCTAALNIPMSMDEVNAGLVAAKGATEVMGTSGAVGLLVMLFMAVTSTGSAELIAVASLWTYDIYMELRSKALSRMNSDEQDLHLKVVSRIFICCFGIFMGVLAMILQAIGLSLGYVYLLMGVLIGSAVAPSFAIVVWNKTNKWAATAAIIVGFGCAVAGWLGTASARNNGVLSVETTGQDIPLLVGNIVALSVGALITVVGTIVAPQEQDWETINHEITGNVDKSLCFQSDTEFVKYRDMSVKAGLILTAVLIVAWPMPMYFSDYVFSKGFFSFWIVLCCIWSTVAAAVIIVLPLYDAFKLFQQYMGGGYSTTATKEPAPVPSSEGKEAAAAV